MHFIVVVRQAVVIILQFLSAFAFNALIVSKSQFEHSSYNIFNGNAKIASRIPIFRGNIKVVEISSELI